MPFPRWQADFIVPQRNAVYDTVGRPPTMWASSRHVYANHKKGCLTLRQPCTAY